MSSPSQQPGPETTNDNQALPALPPIAQAAQEMASQLFSPTQRASTPVQSILSQTQAASSPRMSNPAPQSAQTAAGLSGHATPPQAEEQNGVNGQNNGVNNHHEDEMDYDDRHDQTFDEDETSHDLAQFDWVKLEEEFEAAMHEADRKEEDVAKQFKELMEYFAIWSSVSLDADKERGFKRFKTREAHIKNSEAQFQKKKEHFDKVVSAFKSAMELLQNT